MSEELMDEFMIEMRGHVATAIESGLEPSAVAFALSYIATDIGLQITENSSLTFPLLFEAMATAVHAHNEVDPEIPTQTQDRHGSIH